MQKVTIVLGAVLILQGVAVASVHAQEANLNPKFEDLTDADDVQRAIALLNDDMKSKHLHLGPHACDILLIATPGRLETIYTGVCRLKSGLKIMVCGDTGVGEFGYKPWRSTANATDTRRALLDWTDYHCGGG